MQLGVKRSLDIIWQFILFEHNEHELELAKKLSNENGITLLTIYSNRWPQEKEHLGLKKSSLQKEVPVQKYRVKWK